MNTRLARRVLTVGLGMAVAGATAIGQDRTVTVTLTYGAPGAGPNVNFSPKGTQVPLTDVAASAVLPEGAVRPAKTGLLQIGPGQKSWMRMMTTADREHPNDLCRVYLDRNRNGRFGDDGPPLVAAPTQNEKTKAWWSSFTKTELQVPYAKGAEPYLVSFWIVREGDAVPTVARYSVASWRAGTVEVDGEKALVAVMDANNDAVFDAKDMWSAVAASEPDAEKRVLSIAEARPMNRLMFLEGAGKERALEFRKVSPDGRSLQFAVVNRAVTKKADRAPDDELAPERGRPRTSAPIVWAHGHDGYVSALAKARASGKRVLLDFEATWCGPCKTMDEWIWTDQEVAAVVAGSFVGVKLDGDIETDLVARYHVAGYPTGLVVDASGLPLHRAEDPSEKGLRRFEGYQTSAQILALLGGLFPSQ